MATPWARWLARRLDDIDPEQRRLWAAEMLVDTVAAAIVSTALWLCGLIGDTVMIGVTLILSWLALSISALDVLATTDVRAQEDT